MTKGTTMAEYIGQIPEEVDALAGEFEAAVARVATRFRCHR